MKKLVLFDIDGTLLISKGIGREAKRRAMLEFFGQTGDLDNYAFGGNTDWGILADLLAPYGIGAAAIGRAMPAYEEVMARHMRALRSGYQAEALPHAKRLLRALRGRADTLVGLVTGNTAKTAAIKLEMAGYDPASFAVGAYGNEAVARADVARLARRRAQALAGQAFPPGAVIVLGDTPADIEAARAIGAVAVAVCTGYETRARLQRSQPDFLLANLGDFPPQLLG